ncbi:MAG: type III-A CRISPR-associated RAMP protein Csm5 [Syntrophomonadaceae bacterium]|nr:type III-A CRISPR-associated RAMP protein Csm5 [Syntrophomonadaceae bacterium]
MRCGHLATINIKLRALAPVFIGSGERLKKKEYILDKQKGLIYFPDFPRMVSFLKQHSLLDAYENFLVNPNRGDFRAFLEENSVRAGDYTNFVNYSIDAGEAVRDVNFPEVLTFIKDPRGLPYIPGSSLKGALRTAVAADFLRKGDWERLRTGVERADDSKTPRWYMDRETKDLEKRVFYRLGITNPKDGKEINSAVNDMMQGIRISDSAPIGFDCLTLAGKYDRKPDGSVNPLPIFRECLVPGTEACFTITLDKPVLDKVGLTIARIEEALNRFADDHYANYEQHFKELPSDADTAAKQGVDIILGGGSGYPSKTILYNLFGNRDRALPVVAKLMHRQFSSHSHGRDVTHYGVSPHILKTTLYKGAYYQMGRCELIFG